MTGSKNGIVYNLEESPYTFVRYGLVFYFSSPLHKKKFADKVIEREQWATDSLSRRFKCSFDASLLADLQLYSMIETRGFLIEDSMSGRRYRKWQQVNLSGHLEESSKREKRQGYSTEQLIG